MVHYEGGWPREIDVLDDEQKQRYCKKLEKEEGYTDTIMSLCANMENTILQNSAIDIYEEYFRDIDQSEESLLKLDWSPKEKKEFRDDFERPVLGISIQNGVHQERFAAAYGPYDYQQEVKSNNGLIWNIESPSTPEQVLNCVSPAVSIEFHSRETSLLCAGYHNGTVGCYDLRKSGDCILASELHVSHKDYVTKALWVNSKSNSEFFSAGEDGCIKWWDIRNISQPTDYFYCDPTKKNEPKNALVISSLEYESTVPIKYMVGTYCGSVFQFNRKSRTPAEAHQFRIQGCIGPVQAIERNKSNSKVFLTIGDWAPRIWHEELRESCIVEMSLGEFNLTGGCWSPTKMNGFYTIDESGHLNCHDLILDQCKPALRFKVSDEVLSSIKLSDNGQRAYIGNTKGAIKEILLPNGLYSEKKIERTAFHNMIERELKREKLVDSKRRELKLEKKLQKEVGSESGTFKTAPQSKATSRKGSAKFETPEHRMKRFEEITKIYEENLQKTKEETYKMYAEMIFHAETLYMFGEDEIEALKSDMDILPGDLPIVEKMINMLKEKEDRSKLRRKGGSKKGAKGTLSQGDPLSNFDLRTEPLIEEQTEISSMNVGGVNNSEVNDKKSPDEQKESSASN